MTHSQPGTQPQGPALDAAPRPGTLLGGGRYRLAEAHGGAGGISFWRAEDTMVTRDVALTLVPSEVEDPATVKARTARLSRLRSAGLARILTIVDTPGATAVIAEWTPGTALSDVPTGGESPHDAAHAVRALAHAAELAHRNGVALALDHADRIRVTPAGDAIVAFPAATSAAEPESDVRALGATLYLLLTGAWPAADREPPAPHEVRPDVPQDISTLAVRALDGSVHTADTVVRILHRALSETPDVPPTVAFAPAAPTAPAAAAERRRRALIVLGAAVLVLVVSAWLAVSLISDNSGSFRSAVEPPLSEVAPTPSQVAPVTTTPPVDAAVPSTPAAPLEQPAQQEIAPPVAQQPQTQPPQQSPAPVPTDPNVLPCYPGYSHQPAPNGPCLPVGQTPYVPQQQQLAPVVPNQPQVLPCYPGYSHQPAPNGPCLPAR